LAACEERIRNVYKNYIEDICPLIIQYEVLSNRFPAEILNEIRAVFTHLSKYNLSDDPAEREKNLAKIEGHIKRSKLDCYKHLCTTYAEEYLNFNKMYKNVDLSFVDNGDFLPKLHKAAKNAKNLLLEARKTDLAIDSDDEVKTEKSYKKYDEAYTAYSSVQNLINDSYAKIEILKRKLSARKIIPLVIGVLGLIIGILGIFL
jgi:hypothetical protein